MSKNWTDPVKYLKQYEYEFKYEPVSFEDLPEWNKDVNPNAEKMPWFRFRGPTYQLKNDDFRLDSTGAEKRKARGEFFQVNKKTVLLDQDLEKVHDIIKADGTSLTYSNGIKKSQFGTPDYTFERLVSGDTNNYIYTGVLPELELKPDGVCCVRGEQDPDKKGGRRRSYRKISSRKSKKSITSRRRRNSRKRRYSRRR
jgi:hypothetical protein